MSWHSHHSQSALRAAKDKPTLQLSLKGITGAGHCTKWKDAEPV